MKKKIDKTQADLLQSSHSSGETGNQRVNKYNSTKLYKCLEGNKRGSVLRRVGAAYIRQAEET